MVRALAILWFLLLLGTGADAIAAGGASGPGGVAPGPNLVIEDIPAIPAALAEQLARYQHVRRARFLSWLPDGGGMLIATRFAETDQVHLVAGPGRQRRQLTFTGERIAWARHRPAAGAAGFLFGMDRSGDERYQIYRRDRAARKTVRLSDGRGRHLPAVWDRQGRRFAFAATSRNGRDHDIYLAAVETAAAPQLLLQVEGLHRPLDFSPDGEQLLVLEIKSINERRLYRLEIESGQRRPLAPSQGQRASIRHARFGPQGQRVWLTSDQGWEFVRLGSIAVADAQRRFEPLTAETEWDVEAFDLASNGRWLAYALNVDGVSELNLFDLKRRRRLSVPPLPSGVITALEFGPRGRQLAIGLNGSRVPGDVFVLTLPARELVRWTRSETGDLDPEQLIEPELVRYPTFDRELDQPRQIPALVYRPAAERFAPPWPVLIWIHGGPESQARPGFLGRRNHWLQQLGIALVRPNVRGSAGYGKNYLLLDNGKRREDAVRDIGALLDWIAAQPDLDQNRVAVFGGSYGGYMSLASLNAYPQRFRCGIDYVGISNFVTFLENTRDYRRALRRAEYGDERDQGMRIFLDMISPLSNASKIRSPLLVIQGANDPRVPASESAQIAAKVREQGGTVWTLLARDEGHGFVKKRNRDFLSLVTTLFLQRHLLAGG